MTQDEADNRACAWCRQCEVYLQCDGDSRGPGVCCSSPLGWAAEAARDRYKKPRSQESAERMLLAALVFVTIIAALAFGAIGILLATTHDLRRTIKRGTRDR